MTRSEAGGVAGFTLIELVVGLAILSLVALLSAEALRLGTRSWGAGQKLLDASDEVAVARDALRRILEDSLAPPATSRTDGSAIFAGSHDAMSFVATAPGALDQARWVTYRVYTQAEQTASKLSVSWTASPSTPDAGGAPSTQSAEDVLKGIAQAEFGYWSRRTGWQGAWSDLTQAPTLVRVRVEFDHGDRRSWPDLYIRRRITSPSNCHFDLVQLQCR